MFYNNGQAIDLVRTDVDSGLLQSCRQESKLTWDKITVGFVTAVRDRRKYINRQKFDGSQGEPNVQEGGNLVVPDMVVIRHHYDPNDR